MGNWLTELREAYAMPREVAPAQIPCEAPSGVWELPGQFAWKEGGLYGLVFYEVVGTSMDLTGKIGGGLTALWTKGTGVVIYSMNDPKKKTTKPSEVGHTAVYGEDASGKFFSTGLGGDRSQGSRSGNAFQIVSKVKTPGADVTWRYEWNDQGANVAVFLPTDKVSSAFVSLPIYAGEKDASLTLEKNVFTYALGSSAVKLSWPAGIEASLEPRDFQKTKRLVLKIPAKGGLEIRIRRKG